LLESASQDPICPVHLLIIALCKATSGSSYGCAHSTNDTSLL